MTANTHKAIAVGALLTMANYYPPEHLNWITLICFLMGNVIGSSLPDIDQASNRLWHLLPGGNIIGSILRRLFIAHRTLSHSLLGIGLMYFGLRWLIPKLVNPLYIEPNIIFWSTAIGYISHLAADSFTEDGIPLLFPLALKFGIPPIKSWRIKTGKWLEKFVVMPAVILYIFVFSLLHFDVLRKLFEKMM